MGYTLKIMVLFVEENNKLHKKINNDLYHNFNNYKGELLDRDSTIETLNKRLNDALEENKILSDSNGGLKKQVQELRKKVNRMFH